MLGIPSSFITAVIGVVYDSKRWPALVALGVSATLVAALGFFALCR